MKYLTLKEVMELTGKSESTIRNLARKLKKTPSKSIKLEKLKTGHEKILFSEELINSYFNTSNKGSSKTVDPDVNKENENKVFAILERELEEKNRQIEALTDRLKESNLLYAQLQESIKLIEAPKKKKRWFW